MIGERFADRLRTIREALGLSQEHIAERVGVSRENVSKWENKKNMPRPKRLQEIYRALDVTEEQFWDPHFPGEYADSDGPIEIINPNPAPYLNVDADDDGLRALACPRCNNRSFVKGALYCGDCACPIYNLCTRDKSHISQPKSRHCEHCGARTWWSLSEEQFVALLDRLASDSIHSSG